QLRVKPIQFPAHATSSRSCTRGMEFHYWCRSMATSRMDRTHYHGPCGRLLSPSEQQWQSSYWSTVDRTLSPGPGPASTLQSQPVLSKVPNRQTKTSPALRLHLVGLS